MIATGDGPYIRSLVKILIQPFGLKTSDQRRCYRLLLFVTDSYKDVWYNVPWYSEMIVMGLIPIWHSLGFAWLVKILIRLPIAETYPSMRRRKTVIGSFTKTGLDPPPVLQKAWVRPNVG